MTGNATEQGAEVKRLTAELEASRGELARSEEQYRLLVEQIDDGYFVIQGGRIAFVNQRAAELTGYELQELIGEPFVKFVAPERVPELQERYERRMRGEAVPGQYETEVLRKDGTRLPVEVSIRMGTYRGEPADIGLFRDISERRRLEQERAEAVQKMLAAERLAAVGKLASIVAHELRQPLSAINNSVYFLKMRLPDAGEKVSRHLDILQQEVATAERLISDLLDLAGPPLPLLAEVELNEIIQRALSRSQLPPNVEATLNLGELPPLMADAEQLVRVFTNLIQNAAQAMPQGGRLVISSDAAGDSIRVEIQDTGVGIPEEDLARL